MVEATGQSTGDEPSITEGFLISEISWGLINFWEAWRPTMARDIFKRIGYLTRYGRLGYREAMGMPAWERRQFSEALEELIREEQAKNPLANIDD